MTRSCLLMASMVRAVVHGVERPEDDGKVLVRLRFRGTHGGEFLGMAATGNAIDVEVFDLFRVDGGRLVEHWAMVDTLGLMKQLGVRSI